MEFLPVVAILGYAVAFYLLASKLLTAEGPNRKAICISGGVAALAHAVLLADVILLKEGQNFSLTNTLSLLVWIIGIGVTVMVPRMKVLIVAPAVYLCSILAVVGLWLLPPQYITNFELAPAVLIHVVLALLSYAIMLLAALYALQLASIDRRLKQRKIMMSPALPPLMTVERQLYHLVWMGFILLTVGLLTGLLFLDGFLGDGMGHKASLSLIAWVLYAVMLARHHYKGMLIRSAVSFTLSGAVVLSIAYFGARVVRELILT